MQEKIFEMHNIHKRFPGTIALDGVSLSLYAGEIRGLIGENGSGKSTLASIASGMLQADEGCMTIHGKNWAPDNMIDALAEGVGMIVQENGTIPGISVAENLFLGEAEQFKEKLSVNRAAMNAAAEEVLEELGLSDIDPGMTTSLLDFQTRKLLEIAKVHMKKPCVLIIDETGTALSQDGRRIMYKLMAEYKKQGRSVLYISHDLEELTALCDSLTVLRDGKHVRDFKKEAFDPGRIRLSMIGREIKGDYYRSDFTPSALSECKLEAKNIRLKNKVKDVSLRVHAGEIVGIGGLSHCGMHSLGKILFGAEKADHGTVLVNDTEIKDEHTAMEAGMAYAAKDRDTESLSLNSSIQDNIAIAGMDRYALAGFIICNSRERAYADRLIEELSVKCFDRSQRVSQLSGGNKQKVVFGKWIGRGSDVLILDCPTRGVDIGVKHAMYRLIEKLKKDGKSIIMISEELPELIGMSDRILIMKDGRIEKEYTRSPDLSEADLIQSMI